MAEPQRRKSPGESANSTRAINRKQQHQFNSIVREIIAIVTVGAMTGVMFWQSVFGMADDFTSGPTVKVVNMAEADHE